MTDPITENPYELFERAEAEHEAGNLTTAAALFAMAAEACQSQGLTGMAAVALQNRAGALFTAGDHATSATVYQQAAQEAERAEDVRLSLFCRWGQADALAQLRQWGDVLAISEELIPRMRAYDAEERIADTLLLQARAQYFLDDEEAALASAEAAGEQFREIGDIPGRVRAKDFVLTVLLYLKRTEAAVVVARDNQRVSASLADDLAEPYHRRRYGEALLADDEAAAAAEAFASARDTYRGLGRPDLAADAQSWLGHSLDALDRGREAREVLAEAVAVLDAAGPGSAFARDRARIRLADLHYESGRTGEAIAEYRTLLAPVLRGDRSPTWRHMRPIERLVTSLLQQQRPEDALADLAAVRTDDGLDPRLDAVVRAGRCWTRWHTEGPDGAGAEAEALQAHEGLTGVGLAQAWVMEMVGRSTASIAHLARAMALYAEHSDFERSFHLSREMLDRTSGLVGPPRE